MGNCGPSSNRSIQTIRTMPMLDMAALSGSRSRRARRRAILRLRASGSQTMPCPTNTLMFRTSRQRAAAKSFKPD